MSTALRERTIADFGEQWSVYTDNDGYYGSVGLFKDVVGPLLDVDSLQGVVAADIGAGTGRFTTLMLECGARKVLAVEPSKGMDALRANGAPWGDRIEYLSIGGEDFRPAAPVDFVFSYGVLHHIPEPDPVVRAAFHALRPGGRICVWLYGHENNVLYVTLLSTIARATRRMPHAVLTALVWMLYGPIVAYMNACRWINLPLAGYMRNVFAKIEPSKRRLTIYDQLNPAYAKYYRREEAVSLLARAGFTDIKLFHRHGYSWTAVATRP